MSRKISALESLLHNGDIEKVLSTPADTSGLDQSINGFLGLSILFG